MKEGHHYKPMDTKDNKKNYDEELYVHKLDNLMK